MKLGFTTTDADVGAPQRATDKSFGYDLAAKERVTIDPGKTEIVKTGLELSDDLPHRDFPIEFGGSGEGIAMLILPRSSLALKHGLIIVNSPGLIDADYTGEIGIILANMLSPTPVTIDKGSRIAQALFVSVILPSSFIVANGAGVARAERGGFGSTG